MKKLEKCVFQNTQKCEVIKISMFLKDVALLTKTAFIWSKIQYKQQYCEKNHFKVYFIPLMAKLKSSYFSAVNILTDVYDLCHCLLISVILNKLCMCINMFSKHRRPCFSTVDDWTLISNVCFWLALLWFQRVWISPHFDSRLYAYIYLTLTS